MSTFKVGDKVKVDSEIYPDLTGIITDERPTKGYYAIKTEHGEYTRGAVGLELISEQVRPVQGDLVKVTFSDGQVLQGTARGKYSYVDELHLNVAGKSVWIKTDFTNVEVIQPPLVEPTGFGAVVQSYSTVYVRDSHLWKSQSSGLQFTWEQLDKSDLEILSEGVQL